jgi:hypothetical protein
MRSNLHLISARATPLELLAAIQKGRFHMAILSESRRGRHAPNVRSTALGGNNQWRMLIAPR